jgi:hypothetical protein
VSAWSAFHEDVQHDLEDLVVVHVDLGHAVGPLDAQVHVLLHRHFVHQHERAIERRQDRLARELGRGGTRELEEAHDDPVEARHLLEDEIGELTPRVVALQAPLEQLRGAADSGERVPDLVRDSGRELADGREPVATPPLVLARLLLPQILEERQRPEERPLTSLEGQELERHGEDVPGARHHLDFVRLLRRRARARRHVPLALRSAEDARGVLALELIGLESKELGRGRIGRQDLAVAIHGEHALRCVAEMAPCGVEHAMVGRRFGRRRGKAGAGSQLVPPALRGGAPGRDRGNGMAC